MNETLLIDQSIKKFPKAKRIAVENFTMGCDKMDMAANMNLEMDAGLYKWNSHTTGAIRWVINQKALLNERAATSAPH
jgi:hypothetical protein